MDLSRFLKYLQLQVKKYQKYRHLEKCLALYCTMKSLNNVQGVPGNDYPNVTVDIATRFMSVYDILPIPTFKRIEIIDYQVLGISDKYFSCLESLQYVEDTEQNKMKGAKFKPV